MKKIARTRFAPSPTGFMHLGGARTALFAWLVARQSHGQFILRIEDTDRARHSDSSEKHIIDSLKWLGLEWDEGPDKAGQYGPYRQSQRLDIYKQWAEKLVESGRAYADPYSTEELEKLRQTAIDQKRPFLFREHRPTKLLDWKEGMPLRFLSDPRGYKWTDEVMGEIAAGPEAVDDFILIKSDGFPTYNFAHVVDDYLMKITHVIRSQEFLPSVPKFLNLYDALGIDKPALATLPYVMAAGGRKKLSKRDGADDVLDYKQKGFMPEALVSYLASLGWHGESDQEIYSTIELVKHFSLNRVQKSGAMFDERKLLWTNGHFIRQMPLAELYKASESFWPLKASGKSKDFKQKILALLQERLKYLAEIPELSNFFFDRPAIDISLLRSDKALSKVEVSRLVELIDDAVNELEQSGFSGKELSGCLNKLLEQSGEKPAVLFGIIRLATTWSAASPGLAGTLEVLGKEESLMRLKQASEALSSAK